MLLKVRIPVEKGNEAIKDGSLGRTMESVFEQIKPEAAYFVAEDGKRTGYVFFDMQDVSQVPAIAEPFFLNLDAEIEMIPAMNRDDLQKGLQQALG